MEWTNIRETHFWHERRPFAVKYEIEKLTGILLTRDPEGSGKLSYKGSSTAPNPFELELRFEAVLPRVPYIMKPPTERREFRNLYFLRLSANAAKAFDHWTLHLQCCPTVTDFTDHSQTFYEQQVRESIEYEQQQARRVEDPDPIVALQKKVLAALQNGRQFRTAHHEGGSILYFNGKTFLREDYGEEPAIREFATDQEMTACIRSFFDWDARKETYPHKPPELEVWKYIERQLR